jgi:hypothetical protein
MGLLENEKLAFFGLHPFPIAASAKDQKPLFAPSTSIGARKGARCSD